MFKIKKLKDVKNRSDLARFLGFKPSAMAFLLYKKPVDQKYTEFSIKKKSGGVRVINSPCPELKVLQRRLSNVLQDCYKELMEGSVNCSHGFVRDRSIMSNAAMHRNRAVVINIDLQDFFGSINFGRVRGYFIKNKHFNLNDDVATVIAQIACLNNGLPQGAPSSPVISNLIGQALDYRILSLISGSGCRYSRYADDITISTNNVNLPDFIASRDGGVGLWKLGGRLEEIIEKSGFKVNHNKTRVQYGNSCQDVTGLVVNKVVNVKASYRRNVRAMVHRLYTKGSFSIGESEYLGDSNCGISRLGGMLGFVDAVDFFEKTRKMGGVSKPSEVKQNESRLHVYRDFIWYKKFYGHNKPIIFCEGKTDNIYLACAIRRLWDRYPELVTKKDDNSFLFEVNFFHRTKVVDRVLGFDGGATQFVEFIKTHKKIIKKFSAHVVRLPVIIISDNDREIIPLLKFLKVDVDVARKGSYVDCGDGLYVVPIPLLDGRKDSSIEDLFDPSVLGLELDGKKFNPSNSQIDGSREYGKYYFAKNVVKVNEETIDFSKFSAVLDAIVGVIKK